MSLQATTRAAVESAFAAAGDLIASVTWRRITTGVYDPATGSQTSGFSTRTVRAIEDKVSTATATRLELSASAIRLWIPAGDFEAAPAINPAEPAKGDQLQHRGKTFTIRETTYQGANALWEVHADV
jgi:hypothetical protein